MADVYMNNINIRKINGFTIQQVGYNIWAIDEFGIDIMYLIIGSTRALLLDTGIGISNVRGVVETLTDLPYDVINSHHHYDHVGGNFQFDKVYAHPEAISVIQSQNQPEFRKDFLISQEARKEYNFEASLRYDAVRENHSVLMQLEEGQQFDLGDRTLEIIFTPGHTHDCICLLDRKNRQLFSADTVVSTPTLIFKSFSAALSEYIASLKKLRNLRSQYELIFPGHYIRPISGIYIDQLIRCGEEILMGKLRENPGENPMAGAIVYEHQYERASILYTEDLMC